MKILSWEYCLVSVSSMPFSTRVSFVNQALHTLGTLFMHNQVFIFHNVIVSFSVTTVLWRCWLGGRKGVRAVKKLSGGVLAWLSVWSEVQTCIWPSWCHCHSLSLALVKSRLVLPFWYRLTWVVLDKRAVKRVCVCVCVTTGSHEKCTPHFLVKNIHPIDRPCLTSWTPVDKKEWS